MANERERLERLLEESNENRGIWGKTKTGGQWGMGRIPVHYKRINIDYEEQKRLAQKGLVELLTCFNAKVYFTQSMIAGAMLSGDYDKIGVISPSQYGKLIADDTPVLTRKGWKTHGSLVIGDEVISPDGGFVRVLYVHPKGHADREVLFANGERIKCHHVHEWVLEGGETFETKDLVAGKHIILGGHEIDAINEIEPVQGNCITVEGGLYCVGRRLIPTHNSWLTGMIALLMAYRGSRVNVAAASGEKTEIIMQYAQKAASVAEWEIKQALTGETLKKVDRLDASLSKTRLSFAEGGHVTGITLGDTFTDMSHNKAIGRGGVYIVDETALVSETAMAEIGRREFSSTEKEPLLMLSNPHKPGYFYDFMISETRPRELVIRRVDGTRKGY